LSEAQAQKVNSAIIKDHFDRLYHVIQEYSLTVECILKMDETGFVLSTKMQKGYC
ncbi:7165_t:CDS:1, partial [Funneliformis geosporum]